MIHIEHILPEPAHFLEITKPAIDKFFVTVLQPRLLTGSTTNPECAAKGNNTQSFHKTHCWCGGENIGKESGSTINVLVSPANP